MEGFYSLQKRGGYGLENSLKLWEKYIPVRVTENFTFSKHSFDKKCLQVTAVVNTMVAAQEFLETVPDRFCY